MKTTKKKVKITSYKKAYEELDIKYKQLAREANRIIPTLSAYLAGDDIKAAAREEMRQIRNEVIKHDV